MSMLSGIKPRIIREGHLCNIVWVDEDRFVIVDSTDPYVSQEYSWKNDISHLSGNQYLFKRPDVYIKDFSIVSPEFLRGEIINHFAGFFSGDLKRSYLFIASKLRPNDPVILCSIAESYYQDNKLDEAENLLRKVLFIDDNNAQANGVMAMVLYNKGQYKESLDYIKKAIASDPDVALFYHFMAKIYFDGYHDSSMAKECLQKALNIYKNSDDQYHVKEINDILQTM